MAAPQSGYESIRGSLSLEAEKSHPLTG